MSREELALQVGALMYTPAVNAKIGIDIEKEKFGDKFSLALCMEDTITEEQVDCAEQQICKTLNYIAKFADHSSVYIPKIFIRVRYPAQILTMLDLISSSQGEDLLIGFIAPKVTSRNVLVYRHIMNQVNNKRNERTSPVYIMPILESGEFIHINNRANELSFIKQVLDDMRDWVLNIRVGGNDLCQHFGIRRNKDESIYDIKCVSNILADIVTTFSQDYIISGPVFEYFGGNEWEDCMRKEVRSDVLNGFIGKTVIHPAQIPIYNEAMKVSRTDYEDAKQIVDWNKDLLVCASKEKERMNERNTHVNWANKILSLACYYGIR